MYDSWKKSKAKLESILNLMKIKTSCISVCRIGLNNSTPVRKLSFMTDFVVQPVKLSFGMPASYCACNLAFC